MRRVMCFGTFDLFHPGHEYYLRESKKLGNYLIVVVALDENVLKIKKRLPRQNEAERLGNIQNLDFVDEVVLGEKDDRYAVVKKYQPDVLGIGYDQVCDEEALREFFSGEIIRQKPFKPEIYKSSKIVIE